MSHPSDSTFLRHWQVFFTAAERQDGSLNQSGKRFPDEPGAV